MKKYLITLSLVLTAGCSHPFIKTADEACGPLPPLEATQVSQVNPVEAVRYSLTEALMEQPGDYVKCRAEHQDLSASYVYGLFLLEGEKVDQDYKKAARIFKFLSKGDNGYTPIYFRYLSSGQDI